MSRWTIITRVEEDGQVWAEVEELPGCFASGRDPDAVRGAMAEAIRLYRNRREAGERNPVVVIGVA